MLVTLLCLTLQPHGLSPAKFLCPWDFPGKNTQWVAIPFSLFYQTKSADQMHEAFSHVIEWFNLGVCQKCMAFKLCTFHFFVSIQFLPIPNYKQISDRNSKGLNWAKCWSISYSQFVIFWDMPLIFTCESSTLLAMTFTAFYQLSINNSPHLTSCSSFWKYSIF